MSKTKVPLLQMPIWKALLFLSIPIVINNLLQSAYQLINAYWIGKLGEAAIATSTLSMAIIFISISIGSGLSIAGSVLIAQYFGAKDFKQVNHIGAQSFLMAGVVGMIIGIIGVVFTPQIVGILGAEKDIFDQTVAFMKISFLSLPFMFLYFMFQSIMRAIGKPNIPIFIIIITLVLNFFLNPVLIDKVGVVGSAYTTLIAQGLSAVLGFIILVSGRFVIKLSLRDFIPKLSTIKQAFFLGLPSSLEMLARSGSMVLLLIIVGAFGTTAVAGWGAAGNIIQVFIIFGIGLSMATSILVGQSVGAGDIQKAKYINSFSAKLSFVIMMIIGIIGYIFSPIMIGFFVPDDKEVVDIGVQAFKTMALFYGFVGISMSYTGVLRSIGKTQIPMYTTFISEWLIKLPLAYFLAHTIGFGLSGIWWANPITTLILAITLFFITQRVDWSKASLVKK